MNFIIYILYFRKEIIHTQSDQETKKKMENKKDTKKLGGKCNNRDYISGDNIQVNVMIPVESLQFTSRIVELFRLYFGLIFKGYTISQTKREEEMAADQELWMIRILYKANRDGDLGNVKRFVIDAIGSRIAQAFINLATSNYNGPAYSKPESLCVSSLDVVPLLKKFKSFGYNDETSESGISYDHFDSATVFKQGLIDEQNIVLSIEEAYGKKINRFGKTHYVPVFDSQNSMIGQCFTQIQYPNGFVYNVPVVTDAVPSVMV